MSNLPSRMLRAARLAAVGVRRDALERAVLGIAVQAQGKPGGKPGEANRDSYKFPISLRGIART
jgi:hypothetical protein